MHPYLHFLLPEIWIEKSLDPATINVVLVLVYHKSWQVPQFKDNVLLMYIPWKYVCTFFSWYLKLTQFYQWIHPQEYLSRIVMPKRRQYVLVTNPLIQQDHEICCASHNLFFFKRKTSNNKVFMSIEFNAFEPPFPTIIPEGMLFLVVFFKDRWRRQMFIKPVYL